MQLGDPGNKKSKKVIRGIIIFFILVFVVAFRKEFMWMIGFPPAPEDAANVLWPGAFLFFNCLAGFLVVFLFWTALLSFQSLLPITDFFKNPVLCLLEAYRTSWHLILHIFGFHGPAIAVINGKANTTSEDINRESNPGVIVVDFNSAVVLEERYSSPGINYVANQLITIIQGAFFLVDAHESPRVCGPGIVFTHPRERIRGVVDLRKQFRIQTKISCYTREGIELYANIFSGFSIGQDPDVLQITYIGELRPENLRVITLENRHGTYERVVNFLDDLDDEDRKEIHEFMLRAGQLDTEDRPVFQPYSPLPDTSRQVFNKDRVFSAVYAQARNSKQEILPWHELPIRVAASFYREQLLQINYDDLYDVRQEKTQFPLPEYKSKLRLAMRNNGILAFRMVQHIKGSPLIKGRIYSDDDLVVSQVRTLTNSKILRDRGIKVLYSGFGDLIPVNENVYKQRLEAWRISWAKEQDINLANQELEAMRVRSRAHIQAQQDLWRSLRQLFDQREYTDEALALRILQALDQAATDPKTRALLPANIMDTIGHLQSLLLPPEAASPPALQSPPGEGGQS